MKKQTKKEKKEEVSPEFIALVRTIIKENKEALTILSKN
jgi:hypothetical protein